MFVCESESERERVGGGGKAKEKNDTETETVFRIFHGKSKGLNGQNYAKVVLSKKKFPLNGSPVLLCEQSQ